MNTRLLEVITFELDKDIYCIPTLYVSEITEIKNIQPIATSNDIIKGIATHRDETITIIDTRKLLQYKNKNTDNNTCIICNAKIAFKVDKIGNIQNIDMSKAKSPDELIIININSLIAYIVITEDKKLANMLNVNGIAKKYLIKEEQ